MKVEYDESKVSSSELPFKHVAIGEAPSFDVVDFGSILQIEKGVKLDNPSRSQILNFFLPNGELRSVVNRTILATFDTLIQMAMVSLGNKRKAQSFDRDYSVIVVSNNLFHQLSPNPQRPDWVGAYSTNDGYVIYHQDYLTAAFGQSNPNGTYAFGGETFSTDLFLRELIHEMDHSREVKLLFDNDAALGEQFYSHSLWWFEGQREFIAGIGLSPITDQEFSRKLSLQVIKGISCTQLTNSFWDLDQSPTARNFGYQYSARWVRELAERLLKLQTEKNIKGCWEKGNAIDFVEMITYEMIQARKNGTFSGDVLQFLSTFFDTTIDEILEWEREWQASMVDHKI